ncbi:hypothetical protein [Salidesulfovibrio onnuriiensis]|uniref:hypothetical protein n=1 Tax=Salidesulfovibrio onnuriiensis TaxID=2583823 RepID=UPI00202B63CA|nr:hypothetical protein [Salidesulfovibrio onnuriiensis]
MKETSFGHGFRHLIPAVLLTALVAAALFGCTPGISSWTQRALQSADMLPTPDLLVEADKAWNAKEYAAAELYYSKALERTDLGRDQQPLAQGRLGMSAYRNGHFHQARISLEKWANLDIKAVTNWGWQEAYLGSVAGLGKTQRLQSHLKWVLEQDGLPWETRQKVAFWYSDYFAREKDLERSLSVLDGFYKQAPDTDDRVAFERAYSAMLDDARDGDLDDLARYVTPSNVYRFPYALVSFERSLREADDKDQWAAVWRSMRSVAVNADLADREPLVEALSRLERKYGQPRIGLALALPVSGPYAKVGTRILRGAGVAQWKLSTMNVEVEIRVINTAASGWVERLNSLPSYFTVVGGPLRVDAFKDMLATEHGRKILDERAFFTFLPGLGEVEEGKDAWRFFTSREDEVRSLVNLAVNRLGIRDFAVFYPQEKFGRAMAKTFYNEAAPLGARIRGMESYPPSQLTDWNKHIAKLLKVPGNFSENKDVPLPMPDFGAVFIPDGWSQAQNLLPNFFFYEGEQLVFLGPGLWSRALDRSKQVDEHYYHLAVCPGAWWAGSDGALALQDALTEEGLGRADFWVALGFDFVRFVGRMGVLPSNWSPSDINKRIRTAQEIDFSMAAMQWDSRGMARQDLFLFSPVRSGKTIADTGELKGRIQRATARRLKRAEAYKERRAAEQAGN